MKVNVKQEKYSVHCLRTQRTETVYVDFVMTENGWFPAPCNGCEEMNGSNECTVCTAFITSKLFNDPDFQGKIYPKSE